MPNSSPATASTSTENARPIQFNAGEFASVMSTLTSLIQNGVSAGVGNTLHGAAAMMSLMGVQQSEVQTMSTRSFFPVPNTNNVMVSITNPSAVATDGVNAGKFVICMCKFNVYSPRLFLFQAVFKML